MIKVVFFDLDDTIYDQYGCSREALSILQKEFEFLRKVPIDELCTLYNKILNEVHLKYYVTGKLDLETTREIRFKTLFKEIGANTDIDYKPISQKFVNVYQKYNKIISGATELIDELYGKYKLIILSNNDFEQQTKKMELLNIQNKFDMLITFDKAGFRKPDKGIFDYALSQCAADKNEAVLIGDDWEIDIEGALNAGIKAIWFNRFNIPKPKNHDNVYMVSSFIPVSEIIKIIES